MKSYPQNNKQWADEAYQALILAWDELKQNNPFPSDKQKEQLIEIATVKACENRDIQDSNFIKHAQASVKESFLDDYNSRDIDEKINFSLCFALAYFDAHLSLSMIQENVAKDVTKLLMQEYDMSYEGKVQSNVFTINYSGKV
ncbi:hypothetical protein [uncultured Cocleimonas sp.]|uniref:hypothetical protein n=1 Tax=uncultured Cocleimonas sp. TaxID=1051587 RepID=UPI00261D3570|nr:hypothetical protein [uncultured Cocleimonas sp.]